LNHNPAVILRSPQTENEWHDYYDLRWRILREPWQQPRGSEKDANETSAFHCMAMTGENEIIGVGRIHATATDEAQIRYMAVTEAHRHQGIGGRILQELESHARQNQIQRLMLNAREPCVGFYIKHGYVITGEGPTLFDSIPHLILQKTLQPG